MGSRNVHLTKPLVPLIALSYDHQNHWKWHKWCHVRYTHTTSNHRTKCSKPSKNLTRVPSFSLHKTKTKCPGPIKSNTFSWKRFVWLGFLPRASTATRPVITHYLSHTLTTAHVTAEDRRRRPEWFQGKRIGIRRERGPVAKAPGMGVRVPAVWWYRPTGPPTL